MTTFVVYMAARFDRGRFRSPIKIGVSSDSNARIRLLQTGCPFPLALFFEVECPSRELSAALEGQFKRGEVGSRLHGEWFDQKPESALYRLLVHYRAILERSFPDASDVDGYFYDLGGARVAEQRFGFVVR